MKKKFTLLFLVVLLAAVGVNAKSRTTTLWEGTDTGANIEVAMSSLVKGATLNLTFNWLGSDGAQFSCFWWNSSTSAWVKIKDWQWVNNGESYSFILDDEYDAITSDKLCFKTEDVSKMKFAKITQTETLVPTSTGDNLLSENWTASWTAKTFAAQSSAKIGDVIRFSYSAPGGWSYFQFNILDAYGNADAFENKSSNVGTSIETAADLYFEFEITNISDLKKIQNEGFGIKGDNFTLTSVQLLSYADSYDAVSITVGSDGVATYSNGGKNVQISACDGLKAYYASAVAKGIVTLTELTGCIPANTGVIVYGSEGTYTVPVGDDGWPSITTNYLKATGDYSQEVARSVEGKYHYIFAKHGEEKGFYLLGTDYSEGGNPYHTLAAHKAYLETATDLSADAPDAPTLSMGSRSYMRLSFGGGGGTTAINTTLKNPIVEDGLYYTLQGVAVKNPSKGIYILNGKKVFVK